MASEVRVELRFGTDAAGGRTAANRPESAARLAREPTPRGRRRATPMAHRPCGTLCVLPAKIRLGEGEASCRPHSDAARLESAASVRQRRMGVANQPAPSKREGFQGKTKAIG